jgi:uncharacterized protein (TIGR03067 family)
MRRSLVLCLGAMMLIAADKPSDAVQKELSKFEGTWLFESLEVNGATVPADSLKTTRLVLKGDQFTMTDPMATYKGTFKFDLIDMEFTEGPEKGKTIHAIYELEGDTYKVCLAMKGGAERPKEFAAKKGSGCALEVLKREKP